MGTCDPNAATTQCLPAFPQPAPVGYCYLTHVIRFPCRLLSCSGEPQQSYIYFLYCGF